eukprot:g43625.t1
MQNLLLLHMMGVDVMEDLQEVNRQQTSLCASEASKIIFGSGVRIVQLDETSALGLVIHPNQTCAVLSRRSESLTLLRDMIAYIQGRVGVDACLISLDQEKAFDRILHSYMWDALSKMGFGKGIHKWIQLLYFNITHGHLQPLRTDISAKVNRGKSEAMFFENRADRSFIPFTVRTDYLKMLGI